LAILYHGFLRKTTNMHKTTHVIETELAPLIDIHAPGVVEALKSLVEAGLLEGLDKGFTLAADIAEESYRCDADGTAPMGPSEIASRIRRLQASQIDA